MITIENIVIRSVITNSFTVEWDTKQGGTSEIEFSDGHITNVELFSYFHITKVENLIPQTTYNFRIKSVDRNGGITYSDQQSVTTLSQTDWETAVRNARGDGTLPQTYYVKPDGNNTLNGKSTTNAFKNVWYAVTKVNIGDTVLVMPGTWTNENQALITKSGMDIAPITIKAHSTNPLFHRNIYSAGYEFNFNRVSFWELENITISGASYYRPSSDGPAPIGQRPINITESSHHINISKCYLGNDLYTGIWIGNESHHCIVKDVIVNKSFWNGIFIQQRESTISTSHILIDNVIVSNQAEHTYFDIHSNNDTTGSNLKYITLWNCTADTDHLNCWTSAPIYIHPGARYINSVPVKGTCMDYYIAIINFKAYNIHRNVISCDGGIADELYVENLNTENTLGLYITGEGKNIQFKNININMRTDLSNVAQYEAAADGCYLHGLGINGLKFENVHINNISTVPITIYATSAWNGICNKPPTGQIYTPRLFFNYYPQGVTNLEIINCPGFQGNNQTCPTPQGYFNITQA